MNAFLSQTKLGLLLALRNRMALAYGFLFPQIFLLTFFVLYRHDEFPIALHLGELLTVTLLGGACFGLPTTLVSEREAGVWRLYRLTPARPAVLIGAVVAARLALILAAVALQMALALALGMPAPQRPADLLAALLLAAFAFMGLGLVIAMLADNVPAVQALGQCIFLPMLVIGGVAVRLTALPEWAIHVSAFFPGRYAVSALQSSATGSGLEDRGFDLLALVMIGAGAFVAALGMFRWNPGGRSEARRRSWLLLALGMWVLVGGLAEVQGRIAPYRPVVEEVGRPEDFARSSPPAPVPTAASANRQGRAFPGTKVVATESAPDPPADWRAVGEADFKRVAFERLPPDEGVIAPIAPPGETPDPAVAAQVERLAAQLESWPPAKASDPVQRTRNLLYVAAAPDLMQMAPLERFIPSAVLIRLMTEIAEDDLKKILFWIAMNPQAGDNEGLDRLPELGLPAVSGDGGAVKQRAMLYAFKFLGRLTGDIQERRGTKTD